MKSPRFDLRAKTLKTIFTPERIEKVWSKKVRIDMRDQLVIDGIENLDFHSAKKIESEKLSHIILDGSYRPKASTRVLVEKSKGLCRQIVIPHIQDAIVLQCLADAFYAQVKGKAPSSKAHFEMKDHSFSGIDTTYGTFAAWLAFQKTIFKFSRTRRFVVVTDIANFYDSISYIHLRNSLAPIAGVDETVLDMLIYVLSSLLWQPDYSPRIEIGLPQMNFDAPRLLAHCMLYEVDSFLKQQKDADFTRFMDDIDVGVDSIQAAKGILKNIDLILQTKQIRLNSGKTKILSNWAAVQHFCIPQNTFLDAFSARLESKVLAGLTVELEIRTISNRVNKGLKSGSFESGNGGKILKRWLTLAKKYNASITDESIRNIMVNRPDQRSSITGYLQATGFKPKHLRLMRSIASSGMFVDEASWLDLVAKLLHSKWTNKRGKLYLEALIDLIDAENVFGFYAKTLLLSRLRQLDKLWSTVVKHEANWRAHLMLGRLVGAFYPQMHELGKAEIFIRIINRSGNEAALDAMTFHLNLSSNPNVFAANRALLESQNSSLPLGYTFPKVLSLSSALANPNVKPALIAGLKAKTAFLKEDTYLKDMPCLS